MEFIYSAVLGLVVGSFLNVLIERMPRGENIIWKPSHCDYCKKTLRWFELIPLLSFAVQRGRCLRCRKKLSCQYPVIEMVTAAGFVLSFIYASGSVTLFLLSIGVFSVSLVIWMIDWKTHTIPDALVVALFIMALYALALLPPPVRFVHVASGLLSGAGFFLLWLLTRGRGLGFGDVKLVTVLGVLLGFPSIVIALYIAFLTGALWGVILMIGKRARMKSRIAFGPFLLIGMAGAVLWGDRIVSWWQSLV